MFPFNQEEIFTSGYVAARYLSGRGYKGKVYLVCTSGTKSEFEQLGMECIGVGVSGRDKGGSRVPCLLHP